MPERQPGWPLSQALPFRAMACRRTGRGTEQGQNNERAAPHTEVAIRVRCAHSRRQKTPAGERPAHMRRVRAVGGGWEQEDGGAGGPRPSASSTRRGGASGSSWSPPR